MVPRARRGSVVRSPTVRATTTTIALVGALLIAACEEPRRDPPGTARASDPVAPTDLRIRRRVRSVVGGRVGHGPRAESTALSLALVDRGVLRWAAGFGSPAAGPDTPFRAASLAKILVAMAVLRAAEEGRLALDDPLARHLPDFDPPTRFPGARAITVRDLLAHRAGLPADRLAGMWSRHPSDWHGLVRELQTAVPPHPPGEVTVYSNLGYVLLADVLERIHGRPFADLMSTELLIPLGMRGASFEAGSPFGLRWIPAGGLVASAEDLARLIRVFLADVDTGVLAPDSRQAMLTPQEPGIGLDLDVHTGLAWQLTRADLPDAGVVAWHTGATPDAHAQMMLLPEHGLGVAVLANGSGAAPLVDQVAVTILRAVLEERGVVPRAPALPPRAAAVGPTDHQGRFVTDNASLVVRWDGSALRSHSLAGTARLIPLADGTFEAEGLGGLRVAFEHVEGHGLLVGIERDTRFRLGVEVHPVPIPAAWRERLGAYRLLGPPGDIPMMAEPELVEDDGFLLLSFSGRLSQPPTPVHLVLQPRSDTTAEIAGLARGQGELIEVDPAGDLRWSGYRLRAL